MNEKNNVFISLGTNVGNTLENIKTVLIELANVPEIKILEVSKNYITSPIGYQDQDDFINSAIKIETTLSPVDLLNAAKVIEKKMGRIKLIEKGPRLIDIDILYYEDERESDVRPIMPHPSMFERAFVLAPLLEIEQRSSIFGKDLNKCLKESLKSQSAEINQ